MTSSEYTSRINRVIDHIEAHLDEELTLEQLARVAHFSPYHFHRIFGALTGETLSRFIQRLRVEKAARMLVHNPNTSITEIALDCGFSSSSTFARAFRNRFDVSASEWRAAADRKMSNRVRKGGQTVRKDSEAAEVSQVYLDPTTNQLKWRVEMNDESQLEAEVVVRETEPMHLAYLRHVGPYQGDAELFDGLWGKMMQWAGPRGLMRPPETQALTLYHDDPSVTPDDKLRISICITVPEGTSAEGEIGTMTLEGGQVAVATFELLPHQYGDAWTAVYGGWLPSSGFQPDDRPAYELYLSDPKEHPDHLHTVAICVPVRPL